MGLLRLEEDGRSAALRATTLVGRSQRCDLQIEDGEVSGQHARIRWQGGVWLLEDLHSRNGTYVDGSRLNPPERVRLRAGMQLAFGHVRSAWVVVAIDTPPLEAVPMDGGKAVSAVNRVLILGHDEEVVTVSQVAGGWALRDAAGKTRGVRDQEQVVLGGRRWLLHLPDA